MRSKHQKIPIGVHTLECAQCAKNAKGIKFVHTGGNGGTAGIAGAAKYVLMANRNLFARHVEGVRFVFIRSRSKTAEYAGNASTTVSKGTAPNAKNALTTSRQELASSVYTVSTE